MTDALRQELAQRIRERKVLVVAGTGVSLAATNGNPLASWKGLIANGVDRCVELGLRTTAWAAGQKALLHDGDLDDLLAVATQVEGRLQANGNRDWSEWLRRTVGALKPTSPAIVEAVRALGVPVATLNYDEVLEEPAPRRKGWTWREAERWSSVLDGDDDAILHLHGCWDRPNSVVLGIRAYKDVLAAVLAQHLQQVVATSHSLLFVGCGATFEDPNLKPLLDWMAAVLKDVERRHYLLATEAEAVQIKPLLPGAAGVSILTYGTKHDQLVPCLQSLAPAKTTPPPPAPPTPPGIPPKGRFVGRTAELEDLVTAILDDDPRPVVILGPPGIGKSKLTIAALRDGRVAARFKERRWFARLEDALDAASIWLAVGRELGVPPGAEPRPAVLSILAQGGGLLVLDNAETPWEGEERLASERVFAELAELEGVRLVASVRGAEAPGTADWRTPRRLEPLPPAPARELFLRIADRYAADPDLDALLQRLDGLPLAIELVAQRAQTEPDAGRLLHLWTEQRTAMAKVGKGGKKDIDLAASIELSLTSPRMTPAGLRLFAILGRLPHGLTAADVETVMPGGHEAAAALRATGLLLPDTTRLRMLAPVREHAAGKPLDEAGADQLIAYAADLAAALPQGGERPDYQGKAGRAREELANLEALLELARERILRGAAGRTGPSPRELAVLFSRIADTQWLLGSVTAAFRSYSRTHELLSLWAGADPGDADRQRDLSVSWEKLGDVRQAQGDLTGALQAYEASLAIARRLAEADPGNAAWQRDLSVSWNRLGDVRQAQGDLTGALAAYEATHAILQRLAEADPGNAGWQRDLSVSWERLGDVRQAQGDLTGALQAYEADLAIARRLAEADPGNAAWQRDLSVSWIKLGDVRQAQGDLTGALQAYEAALAIRQRLAAADPGNAAWQRDLIVSHWKIAAVLEEVAERRGEAAGHWGKALAVARELAASGRLAPTDGYFVEELERRLAAAEGGVR